MKGYIRDRERQDKISRWTGVGLTAAIHALVVGTLVLSGFQKTYPPPPEKIIVDFVDIDELPLPEEKPTRRGQIESDVVDPERPVEEVIAAQSPLVSTTKNDAPASNPTPTGDVEIPETPETPLDPKAIFPGHSQRDTSNTSQGAKEPAGSITPGQPQGGSQGSVDGYANAVVVGRSIKTAGKLKSGGNKQGTVFIDIIVDQNGKVISATYNLNKSDTTEKDLIDKAIAAAKDCVFTVGEGTSTGYVKCVFKLTN